VVPQLLSAHNVRISDLEVTCMQVAPEQAWMPDPLLLIEILSPSNRADTWSNVWAYTSLSSVQGIPLLDSTRVAMRGLRPSRMEDSDPAEQPGP